MEDKSKYFVVKQKAVPEVLLKVVEAKKLLEEGELKIYEVSLAVGYQSSQYFSQIFYKMTGTYPTNWQRDNRRL